MSGVRSRAPSFAAIVALVALWPLAHRGLVAAYEIDPWKLGGFAMYTTYQTSLVVFFRAGPDGLRPIDETALPAPVRAELERFRARRSALGTWVAPDAAARALHAVRPELASLVVVVQRLWLDRETARIASEKHGYAYADGERVDL